MTSSKGKYGLALAIVGLLTAIVTNLDRAKELWQTIHPSPIVSGPPPPATNAVWTHDTSHDENQLVNILNLAKVDPLKVAANGTLSGDIHIWYQAGSGNGRFAYREIPWEGEKHPESNFFHDDGSIVSIGWRRAGARIYSYFEVLH
ncbi:MAG: hypothetical protein DME97_04185 [Verrucomicrobia bacterium]|nr:MAG: hypothetical protein DME97_04185 [Verrucomicrobiota bacterium]